MALIATSLTSPIMLTTLRPETNVTNDPGGMELPAVNATEAPADRAPQEAVAAMVELVKGAVL